MTAPGGPGQTASLYRAVSMLYALLSEHPDLPGKSVTIHPNGHIDIVADGTNGVLHDWAHALPDHTPRPGFTTTFYGADEADVLEQGLITVTVRRPMLGPGGVSA